MDLEQQVDAGLPEGWRPSEGDKVIGQVIEVIPGWSNFKNGYYPIVVIKDELSDEFVSVHGFHYSLEDQLNRLKPEPGERIGIKCGALVPTKDGQRKVQTYTVRVEGRTDSNNTWSMMQGPRQQNLPLN